MGLDVLITTDNQEAIYTEEFFARSDDYGLSRTFCNFMCRPNVSEVEPELNQIGKIVGVDIQPLYDMENYNNEEYTEFLMGMAKTEVEKDKITDESKLQKEKVTGNIKIVAGIVNELIEKLSGIDNLPELLNHGERDTLNSKFYFADFSVDKGAGYIGNNFGQDLRNFNRFLEYAKSKNTQTVYFVYG